MSRQLCCASLLTVLCGMAATASAQELILGEYQYQNSRFTRMGIDGSNPQTLFMTSMEDWLIMGASYNPANNTLVWMDSWGGSEMHQANLDGSNHVVLSGVGGFARGTSRDSLGRVFFSTDNLVQRMDADGSNIVTIYTAPSTDVVLAPRVDVTNGFVYFGTEGTIKRTKLDGTNVQTVVHGVSQPRAIGFDHANGYIYWIDGDTITDHVARSRMDDSGFEILVDCSYNVGQSSGLTDLVVAPSLGKMFFSDELAGTLKSANLDGSNVQTIYTSASGLAPIAITLVGGDVAPAIQDCNGNGIADHIDIANGATDCDNNGVLDSCQTNPCPQRTVILDNGSMAFTGNGRALGWPSSWQVFQPIDVTDTWTIAELGVDGHTSNHVVDDTITVKVFPDNGTLLMPDETGGPLATTTLKLRFSPFQENWVYAPIALTMNPGRYWFRFEAADPVNYAGSIHVGTNGSPSRSRGSSGNFTSFQSPAAVRLIAGVGCGTSDYNGDGDFGTDADIEAFFACLAGNCCPTCFAGGSDFNADGDFGTDADIESFFRVLAGGSC